MSNLSKAEIAKGTRDETFVKKFFEMDHHMNLFTVKRKNGKPKEGIFVPSYMVFKIDGDEVVSYKTDQSGDYAEVLARVNENINLPTARNAILLVGKFQNDNTVATLGLSDLEKTPEFGGQGGGNRGNKYEDEFLKSLECEINCICEHTKY